MGKVAESRPVHYRHYTFSLYRHTYCGLINFGLYRKWNFTDDTRRVTCKLCLRQLDKDGKILRLQDAIVDRWKNEAPALLPGEENVPKRKKRKVARKTTKRRRKSA